MSGDLIKTWLDLELAINAKVSNGRMDTIREMSMPHKVALYKYWQENSTLRAINGSLRRKRDLYMKSAASLLKESRALSQKNQELLQRVWLLNLGLVLVSFVSLALASIDVLPW